MKVRSCVMVLVAVVVVTACSQKVKDDGYAPSPMSPPRASPLPPPPPMARMAPAPSLNAIVMTGSLAVPGANTEVYERPADNPVKRTTEQPVSTFSVDVDTGSYSNVRRMLESGVRPPADAVRAEEFINYFDYNYAVPADKATPFRVHTELANAPWDKRKQVMMIGIKGYEQAQASLPPMNLVFLIDTSGSMYSDDKLPLLKRAFAQLVPQLRKQDRVAIVAYAGSAGLVLEPTSGDQRGKILAALEQLQAGGSTNGGAGIELAYAMAAQSFIEGGANRVILATDGDFNVGIADRGALETLVGDRRKSGIALTTLGFGTGNYNDAMAERLADVGNGNHAYIDSLSEARRVLVREMGSTLFTIASDVKIQVEFNPARVSEYRLIGYENRVLNNEDFANDKVDAGDIGPGHEVTALYEIVPVGSGAEQLPALRYGDTPAAAKDHGNEVAEVRLRYKLPGQDQSALITRPILASSLQATPSESLRFASAVAGFADALRGGQRMPGWSWEQILATAREARGDDPEGERAQFIQLVSTGQALIEPDATVSGARN
ncbi:hypothetical protein ABB26_12755 [Stenotrophomonas humi]|uniref:VWFA domain-containing protein n=2 Tax=Stenotrophomonas humi TaxID=405444 RepID=A0A0R0C0J6_9GAMM|nr:hypothetical protein ABB26_12755 [Stenotrophomonas humi]